MKNQDFTERGGVTLSWYSHEKAKNYAFYAAVDGKDKDTEAILLQVNHASPANGKQRCQAHLDLWPGKHEVNIRSRCEYESQLFCGEQSATITIVVPPKPAPVNDDLQAACTAQEDHSLAEVSDVQQQTIGAPGSHQRGDLSFQDAGSQGGAAGTSSAASDLSAGDAAGTGAAAEKAAKRLLIEKRVEERRKELALERQLQQQEQEAAVARGIAEDNARAGPVFIFGATGALCSVVNGYYEPTEEKGVDGRMRYGKRGERIKIEHYEGYWRIVGSSAYFFDFDSRTFAETPGLCPLESCASTYWKQVNTTDPNFKFRQTHCPEQPSVKMVTGAEAVQQVGFLHMLARRPILEFFFASRSGRSCFALSDTLLVCLRRVLSMLSMLHGALPRTTRELGLCSSSGRRALRVPL